MGSTLVFHCVIWFGCTSNWLANSESVRSPRTAARATFALNSAEWLRRGRLLISRSCLREHYHALNQAAIPLIPLFRFPEPLLYTIFEESDASHAGAKRYSFKAVVNGSVSKTEVYSIVRQLTNDGAKRTYHRNHLSQGRWGDSEAKVVWTFVYASANDYARGNPICRSLWIDPDLPEQHRPLALTRIHRRTPMDGVRKAEGGVRELQGK